jgi:thioesterase domain-containing protein
MHDDRPVMNPSVHTTMTTALEQALLTDIPLARAMALSIRVWDRESLTLAAPLAPNINDKGCAFGGSLASLMTLAGWGLLKLALDAARAPASAACEIYVQDSTIRYLKPVWQDFEAVARLAEGSTFDEFFTTLDTRGKARLRVHCAVPLADGGDAATLDAQFVALAQP